MDQESISREEGAEDGLKRVPAWVILRILEEIDRALAEIDRLEAKEGE